MNRPRIFLGSSGEQTKLLQAITRGLEEVADVEPWTTTFNPGRSTLERLVELSQEVDFAAFVFAQDDWTATDASQSGQASPRDNVVFEAGLFGGALGIRRTFILHANGSKLPTDLLGLTAVRYDPAGGEAEVGAMNERLRKAIETEGRRGPVEGLWWERSVRLLTRAGAAALPVRRAAPLIFKPPRSAPARAARISPVSRRRACPAGARHRGREETRRGPAGTVPRARCPGRRESGTRSPRG